MPSQTASKENTAIGVTSNAPWRIRAVLHYLITD